MKTQFPKSNISVYGKISIVNPDVPDTENICKTIDLTSLKTGKSGVYCLRNKLNGRLYIGMTDNLEKRRNRHFRDLHTGVHSNDKLLKDYSDWLKEQFTLGNINTSPAMIFEFEIIQYCYPSQLTFWENILIKSLQPYYNVASKEKEIPTYDELIGDDHEID